MAATCFNWVPDTFFIVFLCWQSRKMSGMRTGCIQSPLGKSVRHLPATKQATKLVICCGFGFLSPTSCLPWWQIVLGCHWVEVRGFGLPLNCYSSLWAIGAIGGLESRSRYACSSSELRGRLMVPSASSSASWQHPALMANDFTRMPAPAIDRHSGVKRCLSARVRPCATFPRNGDL